MYFLLLFYKDYIVYYNDFVGVFIEKRVYTNMIGYCHTHNIIMSLMLYMASGCLLLFYKNCNVPNCLHVDTLISLQL